jgi:hypothetical protein
MVDRRQIIDALVRGDFVFLTDLVRNQAEMEPKAGDLFADILLNIVTGAWKKSTHRPRSRATQTRRQEIVARMATLETEGWPTEAAATKVAEEFNYSKRWVWKACCEARVINDLGEKCLSASKRLYKLAPERVEGMLDRLTLKLAHTIYERYGTEQKRSSFTSADCAIPNPS